MMTENSRNANLENIFQICNQIENEGGAIIFTGTNNFMNLNNKQKYFIYK